MNKNRVTQHALGGLLAALLSTCASGAEIEGRERSVNPAAWSGTGASPISEGRGFRSDSPARPCLSNEQRSQLQAIASANAARLRAQGRLATPDPEKRLTEFAWPLQLRPELDDPGYHGISNFVDQDPNYPNQLLDWDCGSRSYDLDSGYNHQGIDFFSWPFAWNKMDGDEVEIIAAADGVIVGRDGLQADRSCGFGGGQWNYVAVQHADGSTTWYGHMKSGSLNPKLVGATVTQGERLGVVGSSGQSTGPHLHMETWTADNASLIEPYAGKCNALNGGTSWWAEQRPYYDSAINALRTHFAPPQFPACPNPEIPNATNQFYPGESLIVATYYRDQRAGQSTNYALLRPDGSVYSSWSHAFGSPDHYAASYWYWTFELGAGIPSGLWTFRASFQGRQELHRFRVGDFVPVALSQFSADWLGGAVRVRWELFEGIALREGIRLSREEIGAAGEGTRQWLLPPEQREFEDSEVMAGREYLYHLEAELSEGSVLQASSIVRLPGQDFALRVLGANPHEAGKSLRIHYSVPRAGPVTLSLYDTRGRRVNTISRANHDEGWHVADWRPTTVSGEDLPRGIYFLRIVANGGMRSEKIALLR